MRPANKTPVRLALAVAVLAAVGCLLWVYRGTPRPPARVILIVVDTLRRDHVSAYGGATPTPNIDSIAANGQVFANLLASFHQTTMSMASLFTGMTPSLESGDPKQTITWNGNTWCGLARLAEAGDPCIPRSVPTLAESLREAGYWTIGVASNQFLFEPSGFGRGFDDWTEVGARAPAGAKGWAPLDNPAPTRFWKETQKAVNNALDRRESDRFFLYVHYMDVHDYGSDAKNYARSVRVVDDAVGRLLTTLRGQDLLDDAVVIFTSDHGERLGERHALRGNPGHYGNPSFQEHLEIPLLVSLPIAANPDAPLRTQDLHRLILQVAGVETPNAQPEGPPELFIAERRYRTYLKGPFKSMVRRDDGEHFLFDLRSDPAETRNLTARRPDLAASHRARMEELGRELSPPSPYESRDLSPEDEARLKLLGYTE